MKARKKSMFRRKTLKKKAHTQDVLERVEDIRKKYKEGGNFTNKFTQHSKLALILLLSELNLPYPTYKANMKSTEGRGVEEEGEEGRKEN